MVSCRPGGLLALALAAVRALASPPVPAHAKFETHAPCALSRRTVPLMVSSHWVDPSSSARPVSRARTAMVVQHGLGRNFNSAFSALAAHVDLNSTVVVAPNFYTTADDDGQSSNWYDPARDLAWASERAWVGGQDATSALGCSTYDVYDWLRDQFTDRSKYPDLEAVFFVGHSDGGAFVSRYALVADDWTSQSTSVIYVAANSPTLPYLTSYRPGVKFLDPSSPNCDGWDAWDYGVGNITSNRYVSSRWQGTDAMLQRYVGRRVLSLVGDLDTRSRYNFGDDSCPAKAQGGSSRRNRGYDYWVYKALLAGATTSANVGGKSRLRQFPSYTRIARNVSPITSGPFHHQFCVVPRVGHNAGNMWRSDCGQAALAGRIPKSLWGYPATP